MGVRGAPQTVLRAQCCGHMTGSAPNGEMCPIKQCPLVLKVTRHPTSRPRAGREAMRQCDIVALYYRPSTLYQIH